MFCAKAIQAVGAGRPLPLVRRVGLVFHSTGWLAHRCFPLALGPQWSLCPGAFCPESDLLTCAEILLSIIGEGPGPPGLSFKSFTFDWGLQWSCFAGIQGQLDEVFFSLLQQKGPEDNLEGKQAIRIGK